MRSGDCQCAIVVLAGLVALAPEAYADSPSGPSCAHVSSSSCGGTAPLSVTARESSATADGGATRAQPVGRRWPCQLVIDQNLRPFVDSAWDGSATFRQQCRALGAARATVIVTVASPRERDRAAARIEKSTQGTVFARVRVRLGRNANIVELIAHEVEHVLEQVEGINLLMEWRHGSSRVTLLSGGAFETGRAIDVGRRVAREVHEAAREGRAAWTSEEPPKSAVARSALKFFEAQQVTSIDEFLRRLRPAPLDPSGHHSVLGTLPREGELRPTPTELSKIESARPVLEYYARGDVVTFKVIEVGHACVGLHARSVLLASRDALALIDGQEFAALVAHEISHEYVWDEYRQAMQRQDHKTMQALELRCDGIAVLTLRLLGITPERLVSAVQKMTRFQHRGMVARAKDYVALTDRVAFIRAIATMPWRERGMVVDGRR